MRQKRAFCKQCGHKVRATQKGTRHLLHLILTILFFPWLVVWVLAALSGGPWLCGNCGSRVR